MKYQRACELELKSYKLKISVITKICFEWNFRLKTLCRFFFFFFQNDLWPFELQSSKIQPYTVINDLADFDTPFFLPFKVTISTKWYQQRNSAKQTDAGVIVVTRNNVLENRVKGYEVIEHRTRNVELCRVCLMYEQTVVCPQVRYVLVIVKIWVMLLIPLCKI